MAILEVEDLHVYYGMIHALKGVSFHVEEGEIVTLIGANGAGKSTTLRTISGLVAKSSGKVVFDGHDLEKVPAHKIVGLGLTQVPEGRRLFPGLSVEDNLFLGSYLRRDKQGVQRDLERVYDLFPRLLERRKQQAGSLSGGEQQMVAMGRGLVSRPQLLLLDEPSMGLAPLLVREIFSVIEEINRQGTTILLVEQNASLALDIAHRAYVFETGSVAFEGETRMLAEDPRIRQAYLGV
ncbi:MAG: ABC transporter ATP-binding protein [Bacillota bacterium]|jgi:branched-chain amino acid transport system ATP-binding protein|nr:ABC transporter ATP-binding protein [Bacillota bacterium]HHT90720.1 ABC transporter ATP-binding protein [Bacillota bacterium]